MAIGRRVERRDGWERFGSPRQFWPLGARLASANLTGYYSECSGWLYLATQQFRE